MTNVWTIDFKPGETVTYNLTRENRRFVAEFDLIP